MLWTTMQFEDVSNHSNVMLYTVRCVNCEHIQPDERRAHLKSRLDDLSWTAAQTEHRDLAFNCVTAWLQCCRKTISFNVCVFKFAGPLQ